MIIKLTCGKQAIIDKKDFSKIVWYRWCFDGQYAAARINGKKIRMHRFLLGEPEGLVDHIDRDKLNNTRENLRVVSYSENTINTDIRADNTSGYKGVSFDKFGARWRAFIYREGRRINLGSFKKKSEAISARSAYGD